MPETKTGKCALIVGDWFVDEHWGFGPHRSPSSSRRGRSHYRALHPQSNEVRAFCGAGRSAFFLHHVRDASDHLFFPSILGLGFWHRDDTEALKGLFNPRLQAHSPYRLADRPVDPSTCEGISLINLNDSFLSSKRPGQKEFDFTTRIIR